MAVPNILGIPVDRTVVLREGLKPPEWTRRPNPWPSLRSSNSGMFSVCIGKIKKQRFVISVARWPPRAEVNFEFLT